ncbi:hypothetical protein [Francisella sp. W12-1067]
MSYIEALAYIHEYIKTPSMPKKLGYLQKLLLCRKQYRLKVLNNKENLEYIKKVEGSYRILLMAALIGDLITWRKGTQFDVAKYMSLEEKFHGLSATISLQANCWDAVYLAEFYIDLKLGDISQQSHIYSKFLMTKMLPWGNERYLHSIMGNSVGEFLISDENYLTEIDLNSVKDLIPGSFLIINDVDHVALTITNGYIIDNRSKDGFKIRTIKELAKAYEIKKLYAITVEDFRSMLDEQHTFSNTMISNITANHFSFTGMDKKNPFKK